jgi:L-alanine-DL-glutamate epimerase-like enolase superfamily enzyme
MKTFLKRRSEQLIEMIRSGRRRDSPASPGRHGMKITQVRAHVLRSALPQPFAFSQGWVSSRGATLVEVETDEGVTGWGEALCQGLQPPRSPPRPSTMYRRASPWAPTPRPGLWHRMYHHPTTARKAR